MLCNNLSMERSSPGLLLLLVATFFWACNSVHTDDPEEAYLEWAGHSPWDGEKVIHGQYVQSPHFTAEYVLYLEMTVPESWTKSYLSHYGFREMNEAPRLRSDDPAWFQPPKDWHIYAISNGVYTDAAVFADSAQTHVFVFDSNGGM